MSIFLEAMSLVFNLFLIEYGDQAVAAAYGIFPIGRILIEVKYRQNSTISENEAIVQWSNDPKTKGAIIVTKNNDDYGIIKHTTETPVLRIPAFAFLYLLGNVEKEGYANQKKLKAT